MPEPESLTDEMVEAKWSEVAALIEVMTTRIQTPDEFEVHPNSELAADDVASSPYQTSHAARWCLNAGVDHLHALKSLVVDADRIHSSASYGLVRGALENFAAGYWVLHPSDQTSRVEHALRWWAKNFRDQDTATGDLDLPKHTRLEVKLEKILQVGQRAGCDPNQLRANNYFSTRVLQYATEHSTAKNPLLIWRLCSGFAHGRPWASLGMNEMERGSDIAEGVSQVRFTTDHKRLLAVALPSFHLMTDLVRLMHDRSKAAD
jgi:hypothetical protein